MCDILEVRSCIHDSSSGKPLAAVALWQALKLPPIACCAVGVTRCLGCCVAVQVATELSGSYQHLRIQT